MIFCSRDGNLFPSGSPSWREKGKIPVLIWARSDQINRKHKKNLLPISAFENLQVLGTNPLKNLIF